MTDKYITYKLDGRTFDVPESDAASIEKKYPSATIEMRMGDRVFDVPVSDKSNILNKYPNVSYAFDMNKNEQEDKPKTKFMTPEEEAFSVADIINDPNLSWRERRKAIRKAKYDDDVMNNTFQTSGNAIASAGATTAKMGVDAVNVGAKMGRKRAIANNPLTGLAAAIELITGKDVLDKDNPLNEVSENLGEAAQEFSRNADPTNGELGFGELLKKGHVGLAMQKALSSGIESAPIMLATKNPYTAGLYMIGAAASNYEDETRDNPDIPEWKRGVNAVGSAALEMAVEKIADIPWKYFGKAGGEITDDIAREVINRVQEEGTKSIAERILSVLGNTAKDSVSEGFEEVITSFGNDALGTALDAIDGNSDYGIKAQWEAFKEQNPDATKEDFAWAKGGEYLESFLGGALSSIYIAGFGNTIKETREAKARNAFDNAYIYGSSLDYNNMYDTNDDVNIALENAVSASKNQKGEATLTKEFIEDLSAEEAFALSRSEDVKAELRTALGALAVAKATQDGLDGKLTDRTNAMIANFTARIQDASDNGTVTSAIHNNKTVFVKGGVVKPDGTVTLPNGQHGPVIVIDGENKYTVDSKELSDAWSESTDEYIRNSAESFRNRDAFLREDGLNTMGPKAKKRAVEQYVGKKILINTENGGMTQVEVQSILPSGQVLVKGKKGDLGGQSERLYGSSSFYDAIARNDDGTPMFVEEINPSQQQSEQEATTQEAQQNTPEISDFRESQQTILINNKPTTVEVTNQDDVADRVTYTYVDENGQTKTGSTTISGFAEAIKQAEAETNVEIPEGQLNQNPDTQNDSTDELPPIPEGGVPTVPDVSSTPASTNPSEGVTAPIFPSSDVHDETPLQKPKGRKDEEENIELAPEDINWDALFEQDPENYLTELQNQFGEDAVDMLNAVIESTQDEINSLGKTKGKSQTQIFANKKRQKALKKNLETLNGMVARLTAEPINETEVATETEQVTTPEVAANEPIAEPILPEPELVEPAQVGKDPEPRNAVEFAARELGLKNGEIKLLWESFKHHTGYSDSERGKFFGLFRKKENGGMTLEEAGERLMELDRENGTNFFDQNDPTAGLDAILEAIQSNNTVGDLRTYTRRQYETDAKREADDINNFIMSEYNDALFAEEVAREQVAQNALTEDGHNELNAKFAEDIYDYEKANKRDALPVSEAEDVGDFPVAARETVRGGEGSNRLLQETQPVQTRGEGDVEEQGAGADVNRENADTPVHNGESSVSERVHQESEGFVSSLDEDMPDFTSESAEPVAPNPVANPAKSAKEREGKLRDLLEKRGIDPDFKADRAKTAGREVADMFATREAYEEYQATAKDFGEFTDDFDAGVEESFANRPQYHIGNGIANSGVSQEAIDLTNEVIDSALEGVGVDVERASDEQTQAMLDVKDELSNIEAMTVYHGSPHKFDAFDHSHMGEGEGAQAHGWGTYVAKNRETSAAYARMGRVTYVGPKVNYGSYEYEVVEDITAIMRNGNTFDEAIQIGRRYWNNFKWEPSHRAKRAFLDTLKPEDFQLRSLYTVEIPEDNGSNYFDERTLSKEQTDRFVEACEKEGIDWVEVISEASEPVNILNNPNQGKRLYNSLIKTLGSDKAVSEFLSRAGFVGIKYDGRRDGECFVIFKEADAKITERVEFYQTPNGTVYGWTDGKKIYLTKAGMNPNTKIHEYTHLWAKAMMQKNPKGWNSIKKLLKRTPVWNEVMNDTNYSNIHGNEDSIASEVLSRISGTENSAKLEQMAQQMIDEAKGTMRKAEARGLVQNIKDALNQFWGWVAKNVFEIENFKSVDEITDRVLYDLVNQTNLGELSEGQVETQIVTDPAVIAELEASPKVQGFRNVVMNPDGTFSSPMAYWLQSTKEGAKSRVETAKFELGKWEEAEEHPELVDENGKVTLVKPNKKTVDNVAYDPYIHNRLEPVNLQFKDAWKRDDLVYVETEVAENDLNDGYHADKALLPVGIHSWSNGDVMLSRYDKPVRVMPWEEVADAWVKRLDGKGVEFDVVPPSLRQPLVDRGVEILPPHKGMGKACNDAYKAWKDRELISRKGDDVNFSESKEEFDSKVKKAADLVGIVKEGLNTLSFSITKVDAHDFKGEHPSDLASELAKKNLITTKEDKENGRLPKMIDGTPYEISNNAISKYLSGKALKKSNDFDAHLSVLKALKDVIANSIDVEIHPDYLKENDIRTTNKYGDNVLIHRLYGAISIDGKIYRVKTTMQEFRGNESNRPHSYEVTKIELLDSSMAAGESATVNGELYPNNSIPATKLLKGVEKSYDKGKYLLDESKIVATRSDIQNAAINYLAGDARLTAIENAVNEEASKLGVTVTYKTREQMPNGHKNDKGYYNTKTGEIVICTENASSVADAIQTILHEAVAHKGLRQLMGDRFNEFINRVYNSLDAETKARVDKLAAEEYDGNTAIAMEEYMAKLAESEDFAKNSVWEKIKSIFEDIMNSLLGRNDIKIGDNELRYILRASYNNMVNPNSMSTIEGWAKDTNMRNELRINEAIPEILSRTGVDPTDVVVSSARQVYDRVVNERWNEFQRQFQDAYQPVRVAIEAIQAETGNIPIEDYENYLLVQNQSSSRSRVEIDNFQRKYYKPIIKQVNKIIDEVMKSRGLNKRNKSARAQVYQEVRQYLIAKHGLERNAYYQNTKGEMRDFAGLTGLFGLPATDYQIAEQMAQDVVDSFEALIGDAARDTLWDKINSATDKTLRHSYESGLISRQQYNDIKAMFNFYIPLRGFDETTAEDVYAYARFEGNRFNPAVQKAEGRTSVADDPIAIIMNMAESEIAQGNKNRAKQALYNYLLNRATANNGQNSLMQLQDVWFTITTDAFGNKIYQIAAPNFAAGETYEQFEARMLVEEAAGNAVKSKKGQVDVGMKFQKQMHKNAHYVYL